MVMHAQNVGRSFSELKNSSTLETVLFSADGSLDETQELSPDKVLKQLFQEQISVYQFDSLLGAGAMGKVFLATHEHLDRKCAVKILSPKSGQAGGRLCGTISE